MNFIADGNTFPLEDESNGTYGEVTLGDTFTFTHPQDGVVVLTTIDITPEADGGLTLWLQGTNGKVYLSWGMSGSPLRLKRAPAHANA